MSRRRVQRDLEQVAEAFEHGWRERGDRVDELEGELRHHCELEEMLRKTLVSAERASDAMRENARREAATILRDSERELRSRSRSVVASTVHLVEAHEVEPPGDPDEDPSRAA